MPKKSIDFIEEVDYFYKNDGNKMFIVSLFVPGK
jgi:hypothetical protein